MRPPTNRKVYVYGLCAGLISGVLWSTMALANYANPLPQTAIGPVLIAFYVALDLTPVILVAASGARLGRRSGSIRDGLIAGAIAGAALMVGFLVISEAVLVRMAPKEWRGLQQSPPQFLLEYGIFDLTQGLIYSTILGAVGTVGALVGRGRYRTGILHWRKIAGLLVSRIETADEAANAVGGAPEDGLTRGGM